MTTEQYKEDAVAFLEALRDKDMDKAMSLFHDEGNYWVAGKKEMFSHAGDHTKQEFEQTLRASFAVASGKSEMTIKSVTGEENRVSVESETRVPTEDGGVYEQQYHFLFVFKDGKIHEWKEYFDTALAIETFRAIS